MSKILNPLLFTILLAIITRVAVLIILGPVEPSGGDFPLFDRMAQNLLTYGDFHGEPAATQGSPNINPGFALWLALLYLVFGTSSTVFLGAQILLGVLIVWGTYLLAEQVINRKAGLAAALIMALWPSLIIPTILPNNVILYLTFFLFSIFFFWKGLHADAQTEKVGYGVFAGFLLGLSALTESIAFYIPIVFGLWLVGLVVLKQVGFKRVALLFLAFIVAFAVVLIPWAVRNIKVANVANDEVRILAKGEFQFLSPESIKKITTNTAQGELLGQALEQTFLRSYGIWQLDLIVKTPPKQSFAARAIIYIKQFFTFIHVGLLFLAAYVLFTHWRKPFNFFTLLLLVYIMLAVLGFLAFRDWDFALISPPSVFVIPLIPLFAVVVSSLFVRISPYETFNHFPKS